MPRRGWRWPKYLGSKLAAGNGADDEEWLLAVGDRVGKRLVGWIEREIFFAREEAEEWPALESVVVANGSGEHRIAGLDGVEHCADCHGRGDVEGDLIANLREVAQVVGELNANRVCGHCRWSVMRTSVCSGQ